MPTVPLWIAFKGIYKSPIIGAYTYAWVQVQKVDTCNILQ